MDCMIQFLRAWSIQVHFALSAHANEAELLSIQLGIQLIVGRVEGTLPQVEGTLIWDTVD